ncbi:MAG: bacteriorhodopsin, partial [Ulvibacter sp.]
TNGFLVAFVVHSILRYSFYNFAFVFIILIILYNKLTRKYETGI